MGEIILRPYQLDFVEEVRFAVRAHRAALAQMPTGGGKTKMFISIGRAALLRKKTVLVITESKKIFDQIQAESNGATIKEGVRDCYLQPGLFYVAMAQTLVRRPGMLAQLAAMGNTLLVITDEVHIGTPVSILRRLSEALHIGFTATPFFPAARHLPEIYSVLVQGPQITELQQLGFLCTYQHLARVGMDVDKLKIKSGEFTDESQEAALQNRVVFAGLTEDLKKVPYNRCLIFTASIPHCMRVADELTAAGFDVVQSHSGVEEAKEAWDMKRFTEGEVKICVSVGKLTKGYDFDLIDLIILQRATASLPLYLQMLGRASRPHKNKSHFRCLDYGGNWERFGYWDQDRDWHTLWRPQQGRRNIAALGAPPVKLCPSCRSIIPAAATKCPFCSFDLPRVHRELTQAEGELIEITELYTTQLVGKNISMLTPEELALYAKLKNKRQFAMRVAKAQELKQEGFLGRFAIAMKYNPNWVWQQQRELRDVKEIPYQDWVLK